MYASHFGLHTEAFALTPDPSFLYLSPDHSEGLAALKIGLETRRGLIVMIGEVGTGKTTLLYSLLNELGGGTHTAFVSNTTLSFDDMLQQALGDFGVPCESRRRVDQLAALNGFLRQCAAKGETAALVIDEAQNLSNEAFEDLRLLSNYETYTTKLLQIVLVGQPELETKLAQRSLRQVAERVAVRSYINPLSREESARYIEHRLRCAGGSLRLFAPSALRLVVAKAGGIPRRINIICHNAMLFAYGRGLDVVTTAEVNAALREKVGVGLVRNDGLRSRLGLGFGRWWAIAASVLGILGTALVLGRGIGSSDSPSSVGDAVAHLASPPPAAVHVAAPEEAPPPANPTAMHEDETPAIIEPARDPHASAEPTMLDGGSDAAAAAPGVEDDPDDAAPPVAPDTAPEPPRAAAEGSRQVQVAPGATLTALAREFYGDTSRTLLDQIRAANPQITDLNVIRAGDVLRLPVL